MINYTREDNLLMQYMDIVSLTIISVGVSDIVLFCETGFSGNFEICFGIYHLLYFIIKTQPVTRLTESSSFASV